MNANVKNYLLLIISLFCSAPFLCAMDDTITDAIKEAMDSDEQEWALFLEKFREYSREKEREEPEIMRRAMGLWKGFIFCEKIRQYYHDRTLPESLRATVENNDTAATRFILYDLDQHNQGPPNFVPTLVNTKYPDNKSLLEIAEENNNSRMIKLLKQYRATTAPSINQQTSCLHLLLNKLSSRTAISSISCVSILLAILVFS